MADLGLKCPYCGCSSLTPVGDAFVEAGEYDGNGYTHEGNHGAYQCQNCKRGFIEWDGIQSYLDALENEEKKDD